jgi:hypothetical protein
MEDRVKKSLWIITVNPALLIPIICFIVTVGGPENLRFITPEALKESIGKKDANFLNWIHSLKLYTCSAILEGLSIFHRHQRSTVKQPNNF